MTPPAPITYRFERADCWRLGRILYRPSPRARLIRVLFLAICVLAGVVIGARGWPDAAVWRVLFGEPWFVAFVIGMVLVSQFSHFISVGTLWLRFESLAVADKMVTLTFRDDVLAMDVEGTQSSVPWRNFIARVERPDILLLKIGKWEALTIPRRAFPDDASWQAARAFLEEKVPHGEA